MPSSVREVIEEILDDIHALLKKHRSLNHG